MFENESFPADLLLLGSNIPKGVCYIETKNLDGETNLKHKQAHKEVFRLATSDQDVRDNFTGAQVTCETPNEFIYTFEGNLTFQSQTIPLTPDHLLLRGSNLRNTEYVYGAVVFTGHETKVMKNSAKARSKKSKIELSLNSYILVTILMQCVVCLFGALYTSTW